MSELEKAILEWIDKTAPEFYLCNFIPSLEVRKREITDIGFLTYFNMHSVGSRLSSQSSGNVPGPYIETPDLAGGADSLIHIRDGQIEFLEVYALEDENANRINNFELRSWG
ncbi:hypothetical protein [Microbulbifer sp.]|uniref:hypothetical protein n=1 Tax=Microbulbifer sp. TaxID=1908541 RepID=UPI003F2BE7B7